MNSRNITDHKLNGLNEALRVTALDEPGKGGANFLYLIDRAGAPDSQVQLKFQEGPIKTEEDYNGITNEALLAVVIDRMRGFQGLFVKPKASETGDPGIDNPQRVFACKENAMALTHLEEALMWLQKRTRDRMARGVEGSHAP